MERSNQPAAAWVTAWVKPEIGIRAVRTKQVACDVLARRHPRGGRCRSLTNKDSIERSASKMIGCNQDVYARSLDAIWGWTSPGASLAFSFLSTVAATGYED